MMYAVDNDFAHACRAASLAIFSRKVPSGASTSALVEYLKSERPIGQGEREYLADLIAGELRPPRGRSALKAKERERRRAALARLAEVKAGLRKQRVRGYHERGLEAVAAELRIPVERLDEWYRTKKHD